MTMRYVLYHATWCPYCRDFAPKFRELVPDGEEVMLDNEMDPRWIKFNIPLVPTVIAFEGDKEVKRIVAGPGIGITDQMFQDFLE
jgi:thiol-disulfide isomerase/thioredoxin